MEEIDWRSVRAGVCVLSGPARSLQSEKVWRERSCCFGRIWEERKNLEEVAYPLLPPICYDSMAFKSWFGDSESFHAAKQTSC